MSVSSGYPLTADAAAYCTQKRAHSFNKGDVYDTSMAPNVACRGLQPGGPMSSPTFPGRWVGSADAGDTRPPHKPPPRPPRRRGEAWLFFPQPNGTCACHPAEPPGNVSCAAPQLSAADVAQAVAGKPWAVFVHGGYATPELT
jgi:hypothetical protein